MLRAPLGLLPLPGKLVFAIIVVLLNRNINVTVRALQPHHGPLYLCCSSIRISLSTGLGLSEASVQQGLGTADGTSTPPRTSSSSSPSMTTVAAVSRVRSRLREEGGSCFHAGR